MKTFIFTHWNLKKPQRGKIYIAATRLADAQKKFHEYVKYGMKIGVYKVCDIWTYEKVEVI